MNLIQTLPLLNQLAAISFRIGLLDLAWLGLVFTGSAFVLQLTMAGAYRGTANRFLALALSTVVLYALGLLILPAHSEAFTALLATTGPLIYFFVKKLIPQASALHWRDGMHLIPAVVAFCLPACSGSVAFAATAVYIELSLREIDGYHHRLEFTGGDRYRDELRWLYRSLRNFGRLWLLWLPFTLLDYFYGTRGSGIDGYLQFLFAVAFTRIAVTVCLKQTPGQRLLRRPAPTAQVSTRAAWLKAAMKSSRYYEDPDLSLNLLAGKLGLQPHELSRMINTTFKKNFNDFVNEYRVKAAAARMRDSAFDHLSLLGIAYESGFNSQSSFNRSFRQVTGKSPVAYKNSLKKELSNYDLGSRRPFEPLVLDQKPNYGRMFKHHFKTAWRNLKKNKVYTTLNIAGLAVGTVCAALILLWVEDEVTFNHNFKKHNDLYHVMQNEKSDAGIHTNGSTPGPLAAALKNEVPGIVNSGRLSWAMDELVVYGDKTIKENGLYADPSILEMYGMDFIYGNRGTALNRPGDVVISETLAGKFFGDKDPVGRTIKMNINGSYSVDGVYTITGVFKDLPANCYYHFQWVSPYRTWEDANTWLKPWSNNLTETIVELSATASPASVNAKLKNYLGTKVDNAVNQLFLFSMNDWHLRANFVNGLPDGGTIKYVRLFTAIAMIILLIACINFMNLSTARSEQRAKEVGVLKVMGAGRTSLKMKFISESLMMSFLAMLSAIALIYVLMPFYNQLVGKQLSLNLFRPAYLGTLLGMGLVTGLLAGSYPAFLLSSFNPVTALKGSKLSNAANAVTVRKVLVISQFAAAVILIAATIVVYKQVHFIRQRNLGYSKSNLLYLDLQGSMKANFSGITNSLMATGEVENAAVSLHDALHVHSFGDGFGWQGKKPGTRLPIHSNVVSSGYIRTMHMQLLDGRDFNPGDMDSSSVIINQQMAGVMGESGKVGGLLFTGKHTMTVVGVIRDFIFNDIYGSSAPIVLFNGHSSATVMALRLKAGSNLPQALTRIAKVMNKENPGFPFEYRFADEDFGKLFADESLIGKLAGIFAMLAIFISCLGLFGLAAYTAERRTKEIGIRKVLGASVASLSGLLAKEFLVLVAVSCLIAFPVAWWCMYNWLQNYAYRTTIAWWMVLLPALSALVIALVTVSVHAVKAALANPVKSLRSD